MREIKFRIWDINERKFVVNETDRLGYGDTKKCMSERVDFENNSVEINADESYILSEYTGLKDMDGKEIYEGDIIKFLNGIFEVIWCNEKASFMLKNKEYKEFLNFIYENNNGMEIVGNIYENPELLGDKDDF